MKKRARLIIITVVLFCVAMIALVIAINIKNKRDMDAILESSIESQLVSISLAAREMIDPAGFVSYTSAEEAHADPAYAATLSRLRKLAEDVGAKYIYAIKEQDGEYVFVYDTDTEDEEIFIPYDLSPVHERAFDGVESADIMNVDDIYGSFNTGAVPIYLDGRVVGIVSTDIEDTYIMESRRASSANTALLVISLSAAMAAMVTVVALLMKRVNSMQHELNRLAHYDRVTGLPNRQRLFEYLGEITSGSVQKPFALLFIDIDNLKLVNDSEGHDAGDELLRSLAEFFGTLRSESRSFRPSPGQLNMAARIGGDEFIQIVHNVDSQGKAAEVAQELINGFGGFVPARLKKYNTGLSIGAALYPGDSRDYNELIKYADAAMYEAKRAGKNQWRAHRAGEPDKGEG